MPFLASEGCFWLLPASITLEVKNNHSYVTTQRILKKIIGIKFSIFKIDYHISYCSKMKMNGKKLSRCQFHFPGLLDISWCQNKKQNFLLWLDLWDNLIYWVGWADGQDLELFFEKSKVTVFYSYPTLLQCIMAIFPLEMVKNCLKTQNYFGSSEENFWLFPKAKLSTVSILDHF